MNLPNQSPLMHEAGGAPSSFAAAVALSVRDEAERRGVRVTYDMLAGVADHADLYARALEENAVFVAGCLMPAQILRTRNRIRDEFGGAGIPW